MKRAVVFGSFVVDLMSRAGHLPVPGETVKGTMFKMGPGGKGFNQGIGAKRAGADITMVTKIGRDSFGDVALNMLRQEKISGDYIFVSEDTPTGAALIMVDEVTSQNQIMVTLGACGTFDDNDIQRVATLLEGAGFLLTQLETNVDAVEKLVDIAVEKGVRVILNPAPVQPIKDEMYRKIDLITPNEVEASILTGVEVNSYESALQAAEVFLSKGVKSVVITLGKMGALAATGTEHRIFQNGRVRVVDTTGAGDAFNGGLLTALCEGKDLFAACSFATAVGNLAVTKMGTAPAMPTRKEIDDFILQTKAGYKVDGFTD